MSKILRSSMVQCWGVSDVGVPCINYSFKATSFFVKLLNDFIQTSVSSGVNHSVRDGQLVVFSVVERLPSSVWMLIRHGRITVIAWTRITSLPHPLITQPLYAWWHPALREWNSKYRYPRLFSLSGYWCVKPVSGACCPMKLGPIIRDESNHWGENEWVSLCQRQTWQICNWKSCSVL